MNLYEELRKLIEQLKICVKTLKNNGIDLAKKERIYKEQLREEITILKEEGTPTTLIDKLVYGDSNVAAKREARDIAEVTYKANLEAIGSIKIQMKAIEALINKDLENKNEEN